MTYTEGSWHYIVGLKPQYDHMKGCLAYDEYMEGYNHMKDKDEDIEDES